MEIKALPGNMLVYTFASGTSEMLEMVVILSVRKKNAETLTIKRLFSETVESVTFSPSSDFNSAHVQSGKLKPHCWELIHQCNTPWAVVQSD